MSTALLPAQAPNPWMNLGLGRRGRVPHCPGDTYTGVTEKLTFFKGGCVSDGASPGYAAGGTWEERGTGTASHRRTGRLRDWEEHPRPRSRTASRSVTISGQCACLCTCSTASCSSSLCSETTLPTGQSPVVSAHCSQPWWTFIAVRHLLLPTSVGEKDEPAQCVECGSGVGLM